MGFLDYFRQTNINQGIEAYQAAPGAVLLDVRTPAEYNEGHVPGSINVPLENIYSTAAMAENKETPLFVYCHSGARSRQAAGTLRRMGYANVTNLSGIVGYFGELEQK